MAPELTWQREDPDKFKRRGPGGTDEAVIRDAYSQWILVDGRDFDLSNEIAKEAPEDFTYVEIFDALTGASAVGPLDLAPVVAFQDLPVAGGTAGATEMFAALPVRKSSVLPAGQSPAAARYTPPAGAAKENLVIVGLIDDSLNVGHERFMPEGQDTRVDFAWIQDARTHPGATVPYGRELTRDEITNAVHAHGDNQDGLLRDLELVGDPSEPYRPGALRFRSSHGTHVADLAAGYPPDMATDPATGWAVVNRRLVVAQLPALVTQDTSGAALVAALRSAVIYVFNRALVISNAVGFPVPVVLNISYGTNTGARTGEHVLERVIRKAALEYRRATADLADRVAGTVRAPYGAPVEIVMPAGNGHLTRCHAAGPEADANGGSLDLEIRAQPDDLTSSYVEIWVPSRATEISVRVQQPDGGAGLDVTYSGLAASAADRRASSGLHASWMLAEPGGTNTVARLSLDEPTVSVPETAAPGDRRYWRLLLALAPTRVLDADRRAAEPGVWTVSVGADHPGGRLHAWIARDTTMPGFGGRGRQAYFEDGAYDDTGYDAMGDIAVDDAPGAQVTRDGTLSGLATGRRLPSETGAAFLNPITVGSNRWTSGAAALYSAAGQADAEIPAPHVMAHAETSREMGNVLAAGSRNGTRVAQFGTSFSAPQVSRHLADHIAGLDVTQRRTFDSEAFLRGAADAVPRPQGPELASEPAIRFARLRDRGVVIPPHPAIESGIARAIRRD